MNSKLAKIPSVAVTTGAVFSALKSKALAFDPLALIDDVQSADKELGPFITDLLNFAIGAAALVAVGMLIFAGFKYITANGDENAIGTATKTLTFAIVGLVVCFIAVLLVNFVLKEFLGQ